MMRGIAGLADRRSRAMLLRLGVAVGSGYPQVMRIVARDLFARIVGGA